MARKLTLTPLVDSQPALRSLGQLQTGVGKFTGAMGGIGAKARTSWAGVAGAMYASGLPGQFGQVQGLLSNVAMGFDNMAEKGKASWGKAMTGAGVIAAGLGGAAEMLSSPLEAAQAQLQQSVKNSGASWAAVSKQVGAHEQQMQSLGFTYQDTDSALALLTQGLGSPQKALKELQLTADLAARSGGTLADSAGTVVKSYAKSTVALKQFGINLTATTKLGTAAASAQKKHTSAVTAQQKADLELSQLQARLGVSSTTKSAAASTALTSAQTELAAAGEHLQSVQAKIESGTGNQATAQEELLAAQQRVAAATAKLDQAQAKANDTGSLTISQSQQLANAKAKLAAADALVASTGATATATAGDLNKANISGQQILDMLSKKTHGLAEAQAKTFGGDLRKWKAQVIDFGATWGEKLAKPLIAIGPALAGVGTLVQVGFFGKIGSGIKGLVTGIGGLASKMGSLVGIGGKTGAGEQLPTAPEVGGAQEGAVQAQELTTAGTELQTAASQLQTAATTLNEAGTAESTAATELGTSATGLDTGATSLDSSATGLDASATGLDSSATALDAAASAAGAGAAAGGAAAGGEAAAGAEGAAGGAVVAEGAGVASKVPLLGTAALAGYVGTSTLLHHTPVGKGVGNAAEAIANWLGVGSNQVSKTEINKLLTTGDFQYLIGLAGGRFKDTKLSASEAKSILHMAGIHGYAAGGIVPARPGGTLALLGEGGQDEQITPLRNGASQGQGPQVVHYHNDVYIQSPTIQTTDIDNLERQLQQKAQRANFSGAGLPGGSEL